MYGGFIVPPNDPDAHFGVLFWHKDGFSTACGHGTIALGRWAVAKGLVKPSDPDEFIARVIIDVPSGRVTAGVNIKDGKVAHVDFFNVASYQYAQDLPVRVSLPGAEALDLKVDLSWGGATYASVSARDIGLAIQPNNAQRFVELARQIKAHIGKAGDHAGTSLYGVCFFETLDDNDEAITQKNVVVYAQGAIDRSPCGSGTAARVAILLAQGKLNERKRLIHRSIIDTTFEAGICSQRQDDGAGFPTCTSWVRGNAYLTGRHSFFVDPSDPTYPGFFFR